MKRTLMVCAMAAAIGLPMALQPAQAGGNGGAVAAGVLGGLAAGAIIGGAVAQPRYYAPAPVHGYEVEPAYTAPQCYMIRGGNGSEHFRGHVVTPRGPVQL